MINEVIELLEKYCDGKGNIDKVEISVLQLRRIIKALEQQTCEDCKYNTKPRHAVCNSCICGDRYVKDEESEHQTCEDAISREAVLGLFAQNADAVRPYSKTWEKIKDLPPVNPQPKEMM